MKTLFDKLSAIVAEHSEYKVLDKNDVAKTISDDFGMLPLYVEKDGEIYYSVICYSESYQRFNIPESVMSNLLGDMGKPVNYCGSIYVNDIYSHMDDDSVQQILGSAECVLIQTFDVDKEFSERTILNKRAWGVRFGHEMFQFELTTDPISLLVSKRKLLTGMFEINKDLGSIVITEMEEFGEMCPALTIDLIKRLSDAWSGGKVSIEYTSIGIMQVYASSVIKWQEQHKEFSAVEVISADDYTKYLTITL